MITIPCIIKESSEGFCRHTIQDEMFQNREIECVGEISQESVYGLILQLRYLQRVDPEKEITMYIKVRAAKSAAALHCMTPCRLSNALSEPSAPEWRQVWPRSCSPLGTGAICCPTLVS